MHACVNNKLRNTHSNITSHAEVRRIILGPIFTVNYKLMSYKGIFFVSAEFFGHDMFNIYLLETISSFQFYQNDRFDKLLHKHHVALNLQLLPFNTRGSVSIYFFFFLGRRGRNAHFNVCKKNVPAA